MQQPVDHAKADVHEHDAESRVEEIHQQDRYLHGPTSAVVVMRAAHHGHVAGAISA
jgi:hypothetical protein